MSDDLKKELPIVIAKRLTALRLHKTWTRERLAKEADINVYTLKHFERTGQISLERLIAVSQALGVSDDLQRLFKPRARVDIDNWQANSHTPARKRGRRLDETTEV